MGKLQGQHVCGVVPENLFPYITGFGEVPGNQERCLSHFVSSHTKSTRTGNIKVAQFSVCTGLLLKIISRAGGKAWQWST
jgi:hypothetical protein